MYKNLMTLEWLNDDQPVPGVTESGLSEGRAPTSFAACRVPDHNHNLDDLDDFDLDDNDLDDDPDDDF